MPSVTRAILLFTLPTKRSVGGIEGKRHRPKMPDMINSGILKKAMNLRSGEWEFLPLRIPSPTHPLKRTAAPGRTPSICRVPGTCPRLSDPHCGDLYTLLTCLPSRFSCIGRRPCMNLGSWKEVICSSSRFVEFDPVTIVEPGDGDAAASGDWTKRNTTPQTPPFPFRLNLFGLFTLVSFLWAPFFPRPL